jgi:hypothetical protein
VPFERNFSYDVVRVIKSADNYLRLAWYYSVSYPSYYSLMYYTDGFCWDDTNCPDATYACLRPTCVLKGSSCPPPAPFVGAICTANGWQSNGNVELGGSSAPSSGAPQGAPTSISVGGTTIVNGNLGIKNVAVEIKPNASIIISGCLALSPGSTLIIEILSGDTTSVEVSPLIFKGGYCQNSTVIFESVTAKRQGAPDCEKATAQPEYRETSLSVLVSFSNSDCQTAVATGGFQLWYLGPIIGGVALIIIVLLFIFRKRIIPSYRLEAQTRKLRTHSSL